MKILVIGGDKRMDYAAERLSEVCETVRFGAEDAVVDERFDVIVLPLPLTKNGTEIFAPLLEKPLGFEVVGEFAEKNALVFAGGDSPRLSEFCVENGFRLENYFEHEALTLRNAALTAEAACAMLSQSTDDALMNSRALITGYGRIAKFLAARLKANDCRVTIAARRAEQREEAVAAGYSAVSVEKMSNALSEFDFIANTVPSALFSEDDFRAVRAECVFIELATLPEQPTRSFAESCGIKYIYASGLPGKCSPRAAGRCMADEIIEASEKSQISRSLRAQ